MVSQTQGGMEPGVEPRAACRSRAPPAGAARRLPEPRAACRSRAPPAGYSHQIERRDGEIEI
jgi:hypothetical protein